MLRRVAVHLDSGKKANTRFRLALSMARMFEAQLQCIYTDYMPIGVWPGTINVDYLMLTKVIDEARRVSQQMRNKAVTSFSAEALRQGVAIDWETVQDAPSAQLAANARLSDLLIISQEGKDDPAGYEDGLVERVIFFSGRPVLVLPSGFSNESVGQQILFCWDGGREAARALADAAPFIQDANGMVTLTLKEDAKIKRYGEISSKSLASYFRAHRYPISKHIQIDKHGASIGDSIIRVAMAHKADLVVMGAYGHSRLREWILGGATSHLLRKSPIPVLFSH